MCVCVRVCQLCAGDQEGIAAPMEMELQVVESHPTWALGTELRLFGRALATPNH